MPRHENRGARRFEQRPDRPRVLVVCGGRITEPAYLKALRQSVGSRALDVDFATVPRSPANMVTSARRRSGQDFDEVWCVFDVDQFDIGSAVGAARTHGIRLAVSNPCFELWLLLHFQDHRSHLPDFGAVLTRLRRHLPDYDKKVDFGKFLGAVPAAIDRARAL